SRHCKHCVRFGGEREVSTCNRKKNVQNTKIALIFGGFVTAVAAAFYPIFFYPLTHKHEYREVQKMNRAGINQADVQPVGVKIWSDPFKSTGK
ncbi:small integral membrane protein 20, partial [Salarias fasciatus]